MSNVTGSPFAIPLPLAVASSPLMTRLEIDVDSNCIGVALSLSDCTLPVGAGASVLYRIRTQNRARAFSRGTPLPWMLPHVFPIGGGAQSEVGGVDEPVTVVVDAVVAVLVRDRCSR